MMDPDSLCIIHGVTRADAPQPATAPMHKRVVFGDLAAIVSSWAAVDASTSLGADAENAALSRDAESALAHNALLTAYAVMTDVVPVRYGAAASNAEAVVLLLSRDADHYRGILDHVSGAVEYALRLTPRHGQAKAEAAPASGGRAYLAAQRNRRDARGLVSDARGAFVGDLRRDLATIARDLEPMPARADRLLDLAILVPRDAVSALVRIAKTAYDRAASCGLDLALIGPWPTYSFVKASEAQPPLERGK